MKRLTWNGESWGLYSSGYYRIGARYLHREKWMALRGPIPEGYVVHHKDHDRSNSAISNLCCMPRGAHSRHHMGDTIHRKGANEKATITREKTMHITGPKISKAHLAKEKKTFVCDYCDKQFLSRYHSPKLCSAACKANSRYHSGIEHRPQNCIKCPTVFLARPSSKQKHCSRQCAATGVIRSVST